MLAFGIFITHGIACYVAIDLVWNKYVVEHIKNDQHKLLWEYVLRTVIVLITCKNFCSINDYNLFFNRLTRKKVDMEPNTKCKTETNIYIDKCIYTNNIRIFSDDLTNLFEAISLFPGFVFKCHFL